jgi:hypothetical protein
MIDSRNTLNIGDTVEVLNATEIAATLRSDGTSDGLPFMPEMLSYSGKRFKVSRRVNKTCVTCLDPDLTLKMGEFPDDDVFFLEGLRCSGVDHDNCSRSCMIFWKSAWVKKVGNAVESDPEPARDADDFRRSLKTRDEEGGYFCQSTQLSRSISDISKTRRILKAFIDVQSGATGGLDGIKAATMPLVRRLVNKLYDMDPKGNLSKTPGETLNLQPGEFVEVKSIREIEGTLDTQGRNRGLLFFPDMRRYCGKRFKVRSRLERMIVEQNGEMIEMKNTVILEGNTCIYDHVFGGCPRGEYNYWREIWLRRVEE